MDYQERPADYATSVRWLDCVVPDGTWSGNLFDFYRRLAPQLSVVARRMIVHRKMGDHS